MVTNKTTHSHNEVAGDLAGRDIHKHYHNERPSALRELASKFRKDCAQDQQLSEFIEKLQHFLAKASYEPTRDLEAKLTDSGREDLIAEALELKEHFTKKLARLQFSEQAQEIFAHILSKMHAFFLCSVRPKLLAHVDRASIDAMTYTELLCPLYDEM